MKTIYKTLFFALTAIALVSCSEGFHKGSQIDSNSQIEKLFYASFCRDTKTTVTNSGKVSWQKGDVIKYYSSNNGEVGTYIIDDDGSSVEIYANINKDDVFFIAVYGEGSIIENTAKSFTLWNADPSVQDGSFGCGQIAIAKTHDLSLNNLEFETLTGSIRFSIMRTDIAKVRIHDVAIPHYLWVSLENDDKPIIQSAAQQSSVDVMIDGSGTYYSSCLPLRSEHIYIEAFDKDNNRIGTILARKSMSIKSGEIIDLGVIDDLFDDDSNYSETPILDNPIVKVDDDETANCYIVKPNSNIEFNAQYQGNSKDLIQGIPAKAKVLWESFGTDIAPSKGDVITNVIYDDGSISLESGSEGNAVVALIDWDDEILWSWHIWVTDYEPGKQCHSYPFSTTDYMMDRNLGALSATPGDVRALGLLYQWGRKDPFLGSSNISDAIKSLSTIDEPSPVLSDENTGTIEYSIGHPTTFITSNTRDWYYTGENNIDNTLWDMIKTKYDPCPAGWRVSDISVFCEFPSVNVFNDKWKGMIFGATYCGSDAWFPAAGHRKGDSVFEVGYYGGYWILPSYYDYLIFGRQGKVSITIDSSRASGMSVRCQSE